MLGCEFEIAQVLRFIKHEDVKNVVWLTADVHSTAAHYYDPHKAQFKDFDPFWEFVSGPVNAGSFGPNGLDNTFGPQVMFSKAPPPGQRLTCHPATACSSSARSTSTTAARTCWCRSRI